MRLLTENCQLLVIDLQERLLPVMHEREALLERADVLLRGANLLGLPVVVSEQYPKGLGPTSQAVLARVDGAPVLAKASFSVYDDPSLKAALEGNGRTTVVVCGIEAHVCVLQSVLDLLAAGYTVVVVADAISSRQGSDVSRSLARMQAEGAVITSVESLLFELTRTSGTPLFKAISALVK
jgi:nicotinamidase-related amidase